MESCNNPQDVEGSTSELIVGTKEASKGETASFKVCKHQAMLQEEEDRPHYNPHQGGHSLMVYMLHLCHIAQLSWVPFLVLQPTISCTSVTFITLYVLWTKLIQFKFYSKILLSLLSSLPSAKLLSVILFCSHSNIYSQDENSQSLKCILESDIIRCSQLRKRLYPPG